MKLQNVHELTNWRTVLTTSLLETCPTSISPIRTANLRLSFIAIRTTSSGCLISLSGGFVKSAIVWRLLNNSLHRKKTDLLNTIFTRNTESLQIHDSRINYFLPCWKMTGRSPQYFACRVFLFATEGLYWHCARVLTATSWFEHNLTFSFGWRELLARPRDSWLVFHFY